MARGELFKSMLGKRAQKRNSVFGACSSCGARIDLTQPACPICSEATPESNRPNRARIVDTTGDDVLTRCPSCAANVADDDAYCRSCGYDLTRHALSLPSASVAKPAPVMPARRFVLGGAALLATGVALVGLSLVMPAWLDAAPIESAVSSAARPSVQMFATPGATPTQAPPPTVVIPPTQSAPTLQPPPTIAVIDAPTTPPTVAPAAVPVPTETPIAAAPPVLSRSGVPGIVRANQDKVVVRPTAALGEQLTFVVNGASVGVICVTPGGTVPGQTSSDWYRIQIPDGAVGYIFAPIVDVAGVAVQRC